MPVETVLAFLLVLTRLAGVFSFVPIPGLRRGPEMARVLLSLALTVALYPQWPRLESAPDVGRLALMATAEAALGITVGLTVAFTMEAFQVGAQIVGLQAGFSYASMINPATEDESGVLLVFAEMAAAMLFFALGLDRVVIKILARSLAVCPPGAFVISRGAGEAVAGLGAVAFSTGLRLAFPIVALLATVDLGLALLGRLQPNLQLLTLAFPAKMLAGLLVLAWLTWLFPKLMAGCAAITLRTMREAVGF